ncbi:hypothetical protein NE237_010877 [Protea cynaroides]|uniref:Uncharacterized protein n=1 Tax=Protea cynaroides TaxID=273540 RepID=A0A9Q0R214_9MAGN|nr:hypothetical protein NE237_010877 [Protea cynaroides]
MGLMSCEGVLVFSKQQGKVVAVECDRISRVFGGNGSRPGFQGWQSLELKLESRRQERVLQLRILKPRRLCIKKFRPLLRLNMMNSKNCSSRPISRRKVEVKIQDMSMQRMSKRKLEVQSGA